MRPSAFAGLQESPLSPALESRDSPRGGHEPCAGQSRPGKGKAHKRKRAPPTHWQRLTRSIAARPLPAALQQTQRPGSGPHGRRAVRLRCSDHPPTLDRFPVGDRNRGLASTMQHLARIGLTVRRRGSAISGHRPTRRHGLTRGTGAVHAAAAPRDVSRNRTRHCRPRLNPLRTDCARFPGDGGNGRSGRCSAC